LLARRVRPRFSPYPPPVFTASALVVFPLHSAEVYGDNDRLPSGNLLGCFWVTDYNVTEWAKRNPGEEQFDARVVEVVRATHLPAWRASVQGHVCDEGVCDNAAQGGGVWCVRSRAGRPMRSRGWLRRPGSSLWW